MRLVLCAYAPCPDCLDRDALTPVGRPATRHGASLAWGCEGCEGRGYVRVPHKQERR